MSHRGNSDDQGLDLDIYADADEATLRRGTNGDAGLEYYEEDDAPTLPWLGRAN